MNDIVGLNWNKIGSFIGERVKTVKDRPYSRQEILKLLDDASDKRLKIAANNSLRKEMVSVLCKGLKIMSNLVHKRPVPCKIIKKL